MKKFFRHLLRRAVAVLTAASLAAGTVPAYALESAAGASQQAGKVSGVWTLDMWHYSGGYWKVGNAGNDKIRIADRDITSLDSYLQASQQAVFSVNVPQEIAQLVSEGARGTDWQVEFSNYRGRDCSLLFAESGPLNVVLKDGKVEFSATPVFHFNNSGASLRGYVPGMAVTVPLIDKTWGYNIYSVFGNGRSAVQGLGYFNEGDPSDTGSSAIHPSFITGKSGALEAGHPITLGVEIVDSAGYSIGSGTFAAAGACGLHFEFPVSLVFTDLRVSDPGGDPGDPGTDPGDPVDPGSGGDPGDEPGGDGPGTDPGDPVDPGDPTDPLDDPGTVSAVDACLELPDRAYAGHDVPARDCSTYTVDGESMTAARAAELGLGKSSFTIVQKGAGSIRKSGRTGAIAVFDKPGTFSVKLTAAADNGLRDTDTKSIQILKTPAILEDVGGVQKENRKQKLIVTVAQDPRHPVNELTIRLTEPESGESISVSKVFGGAENAPANASHIKYRSLLDCGSDAYFLCVELDFLTKWHAAKTLSYEIRAKDDAGNTDAAFGTFDVAPDLPPHAAIDLEDVYYRREGGSAASITAVCASSSDGDALQRTWEYRREGGSWQSVTAMPGYADLSFGSGKQIRFDQTGVGPFEVRLTVKDRWTEETLEEYVTEADRLSASATNSSYVDNVAPRVGLDLLRTETAEVFVLTESDKLQRDVLAAAPGLKAALLAEGISLDLRADFRQAKAGDVTGAMTEVTTGGQGARDFRGSDLQLYARSCKGMWDGGNLVCDGRYSYLLSPTVQAYAADPRYGIHTYPFSLTARDAEGKTVWTTTVTRAVLDSQTDLRDASWGFDADGAYLYLTDGGRTALFDIRTGTYVATLNQALGSFNAVTAESLYTFKSDGIYRMPKGGGALKCVYAGEISCPVCLGGQIHFLLKADLGKGLGLYRGVFDPESEGVRCRLLEGSLEGYAKDAQGLAIDASGAVFAYAGSRAYCFGPDDLLIKVIPLSSSSNSRAVFPVWSGNGLVRYVAQTGHERYPRNYEVWCRCESVYTDESYSDSRVKEDNYPNYGDPVVFAAEDENGAIGVYLGCNCVYATGERYLDTVLFRFNGEFRNPMGFPMERGYQSIRYLCATANQGGRSDLKQIVRVAESRADEEARLIAKHLSGDANYSYYLSLDGEQTPQGVSAALDSIAAAVRAMKQEGENAAVFSGSLTRGISLAPDTTYYYEYETTANADVLSVAAEIARPSGMPGSAGGYQVTASNIENFDDSAVEPFFRADASAIDGGRYQIASLRTKTDSYTYVQNGQSKPLTFTVPAGYKAVLCMDYEYSCSSSDPGGKQLLLSKDGGTALALDIPAAGLTQSSGVYMHASLLESGSYKLDCALKERTKIGGRTCAFWIDNLKVLLVQEGAAQTAAGLQQLAAQSSAAGTGAMRRVTGSFTTPQQAAHFGAYPCQKATGLNSAFADVTEEMKGYTKNLYLTLSLPAGRQALYAVLTGSGRGGSYTSSSTGKTHYYDARWTFDDTLHGVHTLERRGLLELYVLPENARFVWKGLTGEHMMKASVNTDYGGRVAFGGLQMYVNNEGAIVPSALQQGRFFEEAGALYAEDLVFSGGGRVTLNAPEGAAVRNLRIYSVSGGAQADALNCAFKTDADLAGWSGSAANAKIEPFKSEKEEPARVYAKGEAIQYQVFYSDFEHDPSKKQHWVYTHEPLTDGLYPQAGQDLSAPVTKFYVDGKYTATHWQEDSTGTPSYDKESNRVEITFYVNSGPGNDAPWVKNIATAPSPVKQGSTYSVKASVDDKDKDPLTVTVEVYREQGSQPIGRRTVSNLQPDAAGRYPDVVLSGLPKAEAGTYDVVVTVKDGGGADVKSLRFQVKEERSLTGTVAHTAAWEANRLAWNEAKKGTDAVRPPNMFWPGEALVLNAPCTGDPVSVDAVLVQFPQYASRLTRGAAGADGKPVYTGQLWHASMLQTIGTAQPVPAMVRFTARYADNSVLTWDVAIIFDQSNGSYYQLHRNY